MMFVHGDSEWSMKGMEQESPTNSQIARRIWGSKTNPVEKTNLLLQPRLRQKPRVSVFHEHLKGGPPQKPQPRYPRNKAFLGDYIWD